MSATIPGSASELQERAERVPEPVISPATSTKPTRERLLSLAGNRLDADGRLLLTSQRFRDQPRNLQDARDKLRVLIARALRPPKQRRATRKTAASDEARLERKRRDALKKRQRRGAPEDF